MTESEIAIATLVTIIITGLFGMIVGVVRILIDIANAYYNKQSSEAQVELAKREREKAEQEAERLALPIWKKAWK